MEVVTGNQFQLARRDTVGTYVERKVPLINFIAKVMSRTKNVC